MTFIRKYWKHGLTLLVLAISVGFLLSKQDIQINKFMTALAQMEGWVVMAALGAVLLQIGFQVARLWSVVPKEAGIGWVKIARVFSWGQMVNSVAPARAGEVVKIVGVQKGESLNMAHATGVIISDRIVDMGSLVLLTLGVGIPWHAVRDRLPSVGWTSGVAVSVAGLVGLGAAVWGLPRLRQKFQRWGIHMLEGMKRLSTPTHLFLCLGIGMACWLSEMWAVIILTSSQGILLSISQALWVLIVINIGIAVPVTLANVGVFEAAMVLGLNHWGVPVEGALAIAVVHHGLQLLGLVMWLAVFGLRRDSDGFETRPQDKDRAIRYYQSLSSHYERRVSWGILKYFRDLERKSILEFAHVHDSALKSMVEVGCGSGFYSLEGKRAGLSVCAMDVVPEFVTQIAPHVDEARVSDIETLQVNTSYDLVICAGVLDFVCNPTIAFKNLCVLVSPGGRLVILVPRRGVGGVYYRFEKWLLGIRINLFSKKWFEQQSVFHGVTLQRVGYPVPNNMTLLFRKSPGG